MQEYWTLLAAVAPVFAIIVTGFLIRKARWLTAEADQSLLRAVVNVLYPCLIFDSILGNPALEKAANVLVAPAIGFGVIVAGLGVGLLGSRFFTDGSAQQRGTFAFASGIQNYGYIPIPLIQSLFNRETTGVLFVHNLGVELALWTFGMMVLTASPPRQAWKRVLNVPVIALLIAVALNFAGGQRWIPQFLLTAIRMMGASSIPLALILTGAVFADLQRDVKFGAGWRTAAGAAVVRLGVLPLLILVVARYLPCSLELRRVLVVQAAMPSALLPIVLSKHCVGDPATALRVVLTTSALGLLLIPWWIRFGLQFTGG